MLARLLTSLLLCSVMLASEAADKLTRSFVPRIAAATGFDGKPTWHLLWDYCPPKVATDPRDCGKDAQDPEDVATYALDLNQCLVNRDGTLFGQDAGAFGWSCADCNDSGVDFGFIHCECGGSGNGSFFFDSQYGFTPIVYDEDGFASCFNHFAFPAEE
ncbi:hypothetical protein F4780DRAFT_781496 [Xylariomycetidae sp. FL0641]|nr:hypothetical protein F4780DRAFT_781496 [Xylariomycetidae sp. FL0641]